MVVFTISDLLTMIVIVCFCTPASNICCCYCKLPSGLICLNYTECVCCCCRRPPRQTDTLDRVEGGERNICLHVHTTNTRLQTHARMNAGTDTNSSDYRALVQPPHNYPSALTSHVPLMAATAEVTVCE